MGWGCSSVGRASDRHTAQAGSIPLCGKEFFLPEPTFSANSLTVSAQPSCAIASINICAHVNDSKHWQPQTHEISHAMLGTGSAALAAVVALPWEGDPNFPQGINEVYFSNRTSSKSVSSTSWAFLVALFFPEMSHLISRLDEGLKQNQRQNCNYTQFCFMLCQIS